VTDEELGNVYEFCFSDKGVEQYEVLPSGDDKYSFNITSRYTITLNGVVTSAGEDKAHSMFLFKADEGPQSTGRALAVPTPSPTCRPAAR
jgi:hypothetical protein